MCNKIKIPQMPQQSGRAIAARTDFILLHMKPLLQRNRPNTKHILLQHLRYFMAHETTLNK